MPPAPSANRTSYSLGSLSLYLSLYLSPFISLSKFQHGRKRINNQKIVARLGAKILENQIFNCFSRFPKWFANFSTSARTGLIAHSFRHRRLMRKRCYDARNRLIDAQLTALIDIHRSQEKSEREREGSSEAPASILFFVARAFCAQSNRSQDDLAGHSKPGGGESANGGALERSRGFFPLRSAFNKRARHNQRAFYVIEEGEQSRGIERPGG